MRTPEQIEADEALDAAINKCFAVYWPDESPAVLVDYIVCTNRVSFDDEGDQVDEYGHLYRNGNMPIHRSVGLLSTTQYRIQSGSISPDRDDD